MFDRGKYIIVDNGAYGEAILFPCTIAHSDFLRMFSKNVIVSAGFFEVGAKPTEEDHDDISISVWGESTTLKLKSRKEDEFLLKRVLRKPNMW